MAVIIDFHIFSLDTSAFITFTIYLYLNMYEVNTSVEKDCTLTKVTYATFSVIKLFI